MDVDIEESFIKKCYKCEEPTLDNLKIVYNSLNSKLILWNKYQIFVYEDTEFECIEKMFIPEFQIHLLFASNNYLLCLDCNGNVHITSLKFKSSGQKTLKMPVHSRDQGIKTCIRYKEDHILSLKNEAATYFLCLNKIDADFQLEKKVILLSNNEHWPLEEHSIEKYLIATHTINKDDFDHLNKIFKCEETFQNIHDLVVMSIDKINVYACFFSPKMSNNESTLVKLYSSPAEICNIKIVDSGELHLHIGLTMGTIIRLSLNDTSKIPVIVHLNTALFKMLTLKDSLIYSDGTTMWRTEKIFSDPKFTQLFIKNPYDFAKCGDQFICSTFNKLIYKFSIEDQTAFLVSKDDEYCSAEKLFNNSAYLNKLFEEIDKNNELVKKLVIEEHYITALSLSKRQDVVNKAIESSVTVFESYEEVKEAESTLTEEIKEYFTSNTWIFSVTLTNSGIYETLNKILSHLSESVEVFITLSTEFKLLKTTRIKMEEPLKIVNFLIPLILTNVTEINVNIKIALNIPGALDKKKALTVLYKNDIILTSEYFIKSSQKEFHSLRNSTETTKDLIQKACEIQYGSMFHFTDTSKLEAEEEYTFYVKLPNDYKQLFKEVHSKGCLTPKMTSIMKQFGTEEFLNSKKLIILSIGNERLKIKIHNDGFSNPLLKITSGYPKITLSIRNFFANVIYKDYEDREPGKEFIGHSFYTTTENFQKAVKSCVRRSATLEEFLPLIDQFERNIIGALPL